MGKKNQSPPLLPGPRVTAGMGFNGSQARLPLSSRGELNPKTSPRAGAQRGFPGAESRLLGQQNVPVCAHKPRGAGKGYPILSPTRSRDWGEDKVARGRLIGSRSEEVAAASLFCSASHRVSKARGLGRGFWRIPTLLPCRASPGNAFLGGRCKDGSVSLQLTVISVTPVQRGVYTRIH